MPCSRCSPKRRRRRCAANDVIGRIGGEEFVAVISGTLAEACIAAERVRAAFQAAAVAPDSPQIPATVSIGVASGLPTIPIDVLIARADAMLYRAKDNGRNRVEPDQEFVTTATASRPSRKSRRRPPPGADAAGPGARGSDHAALTTHHGAQPRGVKKRKGR